MNAKKCDRCGALYEMYNHEPDCRKPNRVELVTKGFSFCSSRTLKISDLCPGCMELLVAFLGGERRR